MRKFKTLSSLHDYAMLANIKEVSEELFNPINDALYYLEKDLPSYDPMYKELSSTFEDFYPDGMTEQEAIDFFTEFIKRKGKYVQIN